MYCGQRGPALRPPQPTAQLAFHLGSYRSPDLLLCLSACPSYWWCCQERCHWWVTCCRVPFIPFSASSLLACAAAPGDMCPPLCGPLNPAKASFIRQGGCLPFCAASISYFPRLHPSEAAELGHCHRTFLVSGVPSPRASSCPPQPAPLPLCTQAVHAIVLGSVWNSVY